MTTQQSGLISDSSHIVGETRAPTHRQRQSCCTLQTHARASLVRGRQRASAARRKRDRPLSRRTCKPRVLSCEYGSTAGYRPGSSLCATRWPERATTEEKGDAPVALVERKRLCLLFHHAPGRHVGRLRAKVRIQVGQCRHALRQPTGVRKHPKEQRGRLTSGGSRYVCWPSILTNDLAPLAISVRPRTGSVSRMALAEWASTRVRQRVCGADGPLWLSGRHLTTTLMLPPPPPPPPPPPAALISLVRKA